LVTVIPEADVRNGDYLQTCLFLYCSRNKIK